jgi:hypothetical protein
MTKVVNITHFTENANHTSHLYYTVFVLSEFWTTFLLNADITNSTEKGFSREADILASAQ